MNQANRLDVSFFTGPAGSVLRSQADVILLLSVSTLPRNYIELYCLL
jgi:hypothetical protein